MASKSEISQERRDAQFRRAEMRSIEREKKDRRDKAFHTLEVGGSVIGGFVALFFGFFLVYLIQEMPTLSDYSVEGFQIQFSEARDTLFSIFWNVSSIMQNVLNALDSFFSAINSFFSWLFGWSW